MEAVSNASDHIDVRAKLSSPELRSLVQRLVRRRVPEVDVEDVVQTVLCDALASARRTDGGPAIDDEEQLRKWLVGITRHKVADFHRRGSKAKHVELPEQIEGEEPPHSAREWARWAQKQAGEDADDQRTLDWMAREGGGEKLAHIAASERLPATQVRQRVSRMRRFMRRQWVAELAAVAGVGLAVLLVWYLTRDPAPVAEPVPDVAPGPDTVPKPIPADPRLERAHQLRADALRECDRQAWERCLAGLDEAARLDPGGDEDAQVQGARAKARQALDEQQQQELEQKKAPAPQPTTPPPVKPPYFDKKKGPPQKFNQQLKPDPKQQLDSKSSLPMDPMPNQLKSPTPPPTSFNDDQSSTPQQPPPPVKAPVKPPPQPPSQQSQQSFTKGSWSSLPNQAPTPKKPVPQKKKQSKQSKKKTGKSQGWTKGGK